MYNSKKLKCFIITINNKFGIFNKIKNRYNSHNINMHILRINNVVLLGLYITVMKYIKIKIICTDIYNDNKITI